MGKITAGIQATIAPIIMKLALSPDGLKTQDLYDDKKLIFRAIHDVLFRPEDGIDLLPFDPKTGAAMIRTPDNDEECLAAELRWLPVPPTSDEGYTDDGSIYTYIETTTDELRDRGWLEYENVTPSDRGDQYTIRVTEEGRKRLDEAGNSELYEELIG
jgi:hypothetical protein